jgi:phenylalanyl-tRNA synthetase beta chain
VLSDFGLIPEYRKATQTASYLHPGRSAEVFIGGVFAGGLGEVHPEVIENYGINKRIYFAELNYDILFEASKKSIRFKSLPKYQEIQRDIALTLKDEIPVGEITAQISLICGSILESVELFDIYKGAQVEEGYKSIAYNLVFRAAAHTLVEAEVTAVTDKLFAELKRLFNAELRQ